MPKSNSTPIRFNTRVFALMLVAGAPIAATSPWSVVWTAPTLLLASLMIAWGAESAQFFMSQGFALVILAWMQTLPEFAIEAALAWHQQTHLLIANLTGAIRMLTGLGWPLIYCTAAWSYRRRYGKPMQRIVLAPNQSVQVVGLLGCLIYVTVIWAKGSLDVADACVLLVIYAAYLLFLRRVPAEEAENPEDLESIPRAIVHASRPVRIASIGLLFLGGGAMIFFVAEPFLGSLFAVSASIGISQFVFIQWVAPFVSEFPEQVSAFYWAKSIDRASMALMNMVSSNITQWTLLASVLPIVLSISAGKFSSIPFDDQQRIEILMTLGQSLVACLFLINMEVAWWEAGAVGCLWAVQFVLSLVPAGPGVWGTVSAHVREVVTAIYFLWALLETVRLATGRRRALAFQELKRIYRAEKA